jgi:hypothetical protein
MKRLNWNGWAGSACRKAPGEHACLSNLLGLSPHGLRACLQRMGNDVLTLPTAWPPAASAVSADGGDVSFLRLRDATEQHRQEPVGRLKSAERDRVQLRGPERSEGHVSCNVGVRRLRSSVVARLGREALAFSQKWRTELFLPGRPRATTSVARLRIRCAERRSHALQHEDASRPRLPRENSSKQHDSASRDL